MMIRNVDEFELTSANQLERSGNISLFLQSQPSIFADLDQGPLLDLGYFPFLDVVILSLVFELAGLPSILPQTEETD